MYFSSNVTTEKSRRFRTLLLLGGLIALTSCATDTTTEPGLVIDGVTVAPRDLELAKGETRTLTATVTDATGREVQNNLPAGMAVRWSSTQPSVAKVTDGQVDAVDAGTAAIIAAIGDVADTVQIQVMRVPQRLVVGADTALSGGAGSRLADSVTVRVVDADGDGVPGIEVAFSTVGGGSATPASATTGPQGAASVAWTLRTQVGQDTLQVRDVAGRLSVLEVVADVRAAPAADLAMVSGNGQSGIAGNALGQPLVVKVVDGYGNPVAGASVSWSVTSGTITPEVVQSGAGGVASARWTVGAASGSQKATAVMAGKSLSFSAQVIPPLGALHLQKVIDGLSPFASHLTGFPDSRLAIVRLDGLVQLLEPASGDLTTLLDLRGQVSSGGEAGLFSIALHPSFASNGFLYASYTNGSGALRVSRYTVGASGTASPATAKSILTIANGGYHFGGYMEFGPDDLLYLGVGEGGGGEVAQDPSSLLGKLLRIDVDRGDPYAVPSGNPYAGTGGGRGEIWALGLRNPWRWTIDAATQSIYIADVGQNDWEEINHAPVASAGLNYGWPRMEGASCFPIGSSCSTSQLRVPLYAYRHGAASVTGCSVSGGYVYRGTAVPALTGHYLYGDFCRSWVRSLRVVNGAVVEEHQWDFPEIGGTVAFGRDGDGELYVLTKAGAIYRVVE